MDQHRGDGVAGLGSGLVRVLRAALVSTVTVWVAVAGHILAGGVPPGARASVGILAVAAPVTFWLSRWRWTVPRLVTLLLVVQLLIHLLLSRLSSMPAMSSMSDERMLVWHLLATVVSVAVLRRGEDLLWSLLDTLTLHAVRLLRGMATIPHATAAARRVVVPLHGRPCVGGRAGRGPPAPV